MTDQRHATLVGHALDKRAGTVDDVAAAGRYRAAEGDQGAEAKL